MDIIVTVGAGGSVSGGALRLPISVFTSTGINISTDVEVSIGRTIAQDNNAVLTRAREALGDVGSPPVAGDRYRLFGGATTGGTV